MSLHLPLFPFESSENVPDGQLPSGRVINRQPQQETDPTPAPEAASRPEEIILDSPERTAENLAPAEGSLFAMNLPVREPVGETESANDPLPRDGWLNDNPPRCCCLFCQANLPDSSTESTPIARGQLQGDRLDALLSGYSWDNVNTITYSFYDDETYNGDYYGSEVVREVSEGVKTSVRTILEQVLEPLLDIDFVELDESSQGYGTIRYMYSDGPGYAYTYYPTPWSALGGDVHLSSAFQESSNNSFSRGPGNHGYESLIHETGHALGLKHPGNYSSSDAGQPILPFDEDNASNTVMTYNGIGRDAVTAMPYDIAALQYLYGSGNLNSEETLYQFQSVDRYEVEGTPSHTATRQVMQTIWDRDGLDTLNFSQLPYNSKGYRFDLNENGFLTTQDAYNSKSYTARGDGSNTTYYATNYGTKIAYDTVIENLINSSSDDFIVANTAANIFSGYVKGIATGEDQILGADRLDTIDLSDYQVTEVGQTRSGNDLVLDLNSNGRITLEDYYAVGASDRPTILYANDTSTQPTVEVIGEFGSLVIDEESQTIALENEYDNPVVFLQPLEQDGSHPATVRITNIQSGSFSAYLQEPNYLDGNHVDETVSYFVFEAGSWQLGNGARLEVGTVETDLLVTEGWQTVSFTDSFESPPVVTSQVQTRNGGDFVVTRQRQKNANSFQVAMQEEEALKNSGHKNETIGWLALENSSGIWSGNPYQAGSTGDAVTDNWFELRFAEQLFSQAPQLLAGISTFDGSDTANLRYRSLASDRATIRVQEEQSADSETWHTTEAVDFLAISGSGLLEGSAYGDGALVANNSLTSSV